MSENKRILLLLAINETSYVNKDTSSSSSSAAENSSLIYQDNEPKAKVVGYSSPPPNTSVVKNTHTPKRFRSITRITFISLIKFKGCRSFEPTQHHGRCRNASHFIRHGTNGIRTRYNVQKTSNPLKNPYKLHFLIRFLILCGLASVFSMVLLNKVNVWLANEHAKDGTAPLDRARTSFTECSKRLYPKIRVLINVFVCIKILGVMTSYLIIMSDLMSKVFCFVCPLSSDLIRSPQFWELLMVSVITPICWLKKLDSQKVSSLCAILSALMIICVILSYPLWGEKTHPTGIKPFIFSINFFNVFPTFVFAYTCQQNVILA